jgi:hypothetical protein
LAWGACRYENKPKTMPAVVRPGDDWLPYSDSAATSFSLEIDRIKVGIEHITTRRIMKPLLTKRAFEASLWRQCRPSILNLAIPL